VGELLDRLRLSLAAGEGHDGVPDALPTALPMPTASFGAAEIGPQDLLATCIERADLALYQAKRDGRDCVRVAGYDAAPVQPAFA
jgi:GGDEF domain-containing protein